MSTNDTPPVGIDHPTSVPTNNRPEHQIVGSEIALVSSTFEFDPETGQLRAADIDLVDFHDPDMNEYECRCGEKFGSDYDSAVEHIQEVRS